MKKFLQWSGGIFVLIVIISAIAGTSSHKTNNANVNTPIAPAVSSASSTDDSSSSNETEAQKNAIGSARNYLQLDAFSRRGLINQLSSSAGEGYSLADATYAVNHIKVDWNAEAAKSAQNYLQLGPMSKADLIQQLSSSAGEGFTPAQAQYAANKVYR